MSLSNQKGTYIYGFLEEDKHLLMGVLEDKKLPAYKIIEDDMLSMTVKDIIDNKRIGVFKGAAPLAKVILLNNYSDEDINKLITALKSGFKEMPILAVITPTSINWTVEELIEHLIEEREWYKKQGK